MKRLCTAALAFGFLSALTGQSLAASCMDLWLERNQIYDDYGFCFSTEMGQDYFDNSDCWTEHPDFSKKDQRKIDAIRAEEKRRKCKVN